MGCIRMKYILGRGLTAIMLFMVFRSCCKTASLYRVLLVTSSPSFVRAMLLALIGNRRRWVQEETRRVGTILKKTSSDPIVMKMSLLPKTFFIFYLAFVVREE